MNYPFNTENQNIWGQEQQVYNIFRICFWRIGAVVLLCSPAGQLMHQEGGGSLQKRSVLLLEVTVKSSRKKAWKPPEQARLHMGSESSKTSSCRVTFSQEVHVKAWPLNFCAGFQMPMCPFIVQTLSRCKESKTEMYQVQTATGTCGQTI